MYPSYRFNKNGGSVRVEDEAGDRALQGEWFDHPPTNDEEDTRFAEPDEVDAMIADEKSQASDDKKKKSTKKK